MKKNGVLVIGAGSFIAQGLKKLNPESVVLMSRDRLDPEVATACDAIINCALSPKFKLGAYREDQDYDLAAARMAAKLGKHFVMLSTRKVYRSSKIKLILDELSPLEPSDDYGRNKLQSERNVAATLGNACTILRVGNVYGYELGRRSFFGLAMTRLRELQSILLDVSPFTERDFIAVEDLAQTLFSICDIKPAGVYNLGSGISLPIGRVAQWLIQGYGSGSLEVTDVGERDAFAINTSKLRSVLGRSLPRHDFEKHIKNLGKLLSNE